MRTKLWLGSTIAVALLGFVLGLPDGQADFYKWVDETGVVWLTDDPDSLPEGSQNEIERVMVIEKVEETPAQEGSTLREGRETERRSSAESYLATQERISDEKKRLHEKISDIETDLATAQSALKRVALTDRRGYWFVVDPTGKRVPATYRDPGAIWSTQTWPALPKSAWTKESEERRKIISDIKRLEAKLDESKRELEQATRSF